MVHSSSFRHLYGNGHLKSQGNHSIFTRSFVQSFTPVFSKVSMTSIMTKRATDAAFSNTTISHMSFISDKNISFRD